MSKRTVAWKISRPTIPEALPRERLFQKLDEARSSPAIWVSGPAGSGKTTLVSSYVDSRELPCIWYEIDDTDRDIASFFYHLRQAAGEIIDAKDLPLPELAPEQISNLDPFTSSFFFQLTSGLPSPFLLVFDNYQNLKDEAVLRRVFIQAVGKIAPGANILIISRKEQPASFSRLVARRELTMLSWKDIKLDFDEFRQVLNYHVKKRISLKDLRILYQKLEGWVSGIVLLSEYLRLQDVDVRTVLSSLPVEYFDYYAEEILQNLEPEIRDLLLETSVLEVLSPEMADQLTGLSGSGRILEYLHSHNLFVERISRFPLYYRYHHLFREFLFHHAQRTFSQKKLKKITGKAALVLLDSGYPEESVNLLRESKDWKTLAEVVVKVAPELVEQGRHHTLTGWFEMVPSEILGKSPELLYWKARHLMPFNPAESRQLHVVAMELFLKQKHWDGVYRTWSGQISTFVLLQADLDRLDSLIRQFEDLNGKAPMPEDLLSQARIAASMFFALVFRMPTHPDIEAWKAKALGLSKKSGSVNLQLWAQFTWSLMDRFRGNLVGFSSAMNAIRQTVKKPGVRYFNRIMACAFEAMDCFYRLDPDRCLEVVEEGLRLSKESGVMGWNPLLAGQRINIHLSMGNLEAAFKDLESMEEHLEGASSNDRSYYHARYAWYALLKRDFPLAMHNAEVGLRLTDEGGLPENFAQHQLVLGYAALEMNKISLVEESLRNNMQFGKDVGNKLVVFQTLLLGADLEYSRGDQSAGDKYLAQAFGIGREQGYVNWHFWLPERMSLLCSRAIEAGIEADYALGLVQKRVLVPPEQLRGSSDWPWPVRVYTLGRFELMVGNRLVRFSGKGQQKPLDLLKAIICHGGKDVSEEKLADVLWPDSPGDHSHQNFTTTLHRLRRILEVKGAVRLTGGRVSIDPDLCWVDLRAFEDKLRDLDRILNGKPSPGDAPLAMDQAERVLDLYKGQFLAGDDHLVWKISIQEKLRNRYLQTMEKMGLFLENMDMWREAAELYRKVLDVDDLSESIYRNLMVCYQHLGLKAEAIAVCRRCTDTLSGTLGIEISPETRDLCERIKQM